MVKVGFIVEGGTEKILIESPRFSAWLKTINIELVRPVVDAEGGGNLLPKNIAPMINTLNSVGVDHIIILTDLEDEESVAVVKQRIGTEYTSFVFVAVKAIEAWYLADTNAMRKWLKSDSFVESSPEQTIAKPWQRLKEIAQTEDRPGPGSSKVAFAKKMVKHFGFDVSQSAIHPECPSAKLLIDGLQELTLEQVKVEP